MHARSSKLLAWLLLFLGEFEHGQLDQSTREMSSYNFREINFFTVLWITSNGSNELPTAPEAD
jgi:hypothetical protein